MVLGEIGVGFLSTVEAVFFDRCSGFGCGSIGIGKADSCYCAEISGGEGVEAGNEG
jgi:hypothetical protein